MPDERTACEMALRSVALAAAEVCEEYGLDYASIAVLCEDGSDEPWLSVTCTRLGEPYVGFAQYERGDTDESD